MTQIIITPNANEIIAKDFIDSIIFFIDKIDKTVNIKIFTTNIDSMLISLGEYGQKDNYKYWKIGTRAITNQVVKNLEEKYKNRILTDSHFIKSKKKEEESIFIFTL